MQDTEQSRPILLTGASGYVGGRLAPRLLDSGHRLRCLSREPRKLLARPWAMHPQVEIVAGDAGDRDALCRAMEGCGASYYLLHSMIVGGSTYRRRDLELARQFAACAADAGLSRIIYLGGLGETGEGLSEHLQSRREVEAALSEGGVPVTVLRAAMIVGSGSASFEILRYLVERLPIMVTPRWVSTEVQPIAIRNVLNYLVMCLRTPATVGRTLDIGGPDVLTYRELMQITAQVLGLRRRFIIPVPVLTPRLSSLWIHLVTPVSHRIARPLAEGLRNRVVCRDDEAAHLMPQELLGVRRSIELALGRMQRREVETAWSDAGPMPGDPDWAGGTTFTDRREMDIAAPTATAFGELCRLGGANGYFGTDWLWRVRGLMDQLVGGPGTRRGRRDSDKIAFGDALDFWRVTEVVPDQRLALRAEMRLPGEALLQFDIEPLADGCRLVQTARFKPRGLAGLAYWYAVMPLHGVVFSGMLRGIKRAAERRAAAAR